MKVAVLSDIHGNIYALNAVFDHIQKCGVDHIYSLGDYVGYYYSPKECIGLLKQENATMIQGNHEQLLKKSIKSSVIREKLHKKYGSGFKVAEKQFLKEEIDELLQLPFYLHKTIEHTRIGFYHGAPFDNVSYMYPDASREEMKRCINKDLDVIFFGHSHFQFSFFVEGVHVINVGSVGQARDIGRQATWVLFDTKSGTIVVQRTPYNIKPLLDEVKIRDPNNGYLSTILNRGFDDE